MIGKKAFHFEVRTYGKKVVGTFSCLPDAEDFASRYNLRTREKAIVVRVDFECLASFDYYKYDSFINQLNNK